MASGDKVSSPRRRPVATKYEYLVINLDRRELPDDVTESDQMSSILNRHGARLAVGPILGLR